MGIFRFSSRKKNNIHVNIFTDYDTHPQSYKDLFNRLIGKIEQTQFVYLDFCPNNIAADQSNNRIYVIDLEDIQKVSEINGSI